MPINSDGENLRLMISFVIPTNNDTRVYACAEHLKDYVRQREIYGEILVSGHLDHPPEIRGVRYVPATPASKGNAVRAGIMASNGDFICVCDADMHVCFGDLDSMFSALDHAEIVIGSRIEPASTCESAPPISRQIASSSYRGLIGWLFGWKDIDTQSGLKAFRTHVARELFQDQLIPGFAFDVEIVLRARATFSTLVSVPIRWWWCPHGTLRLHQAIPEMLAATFRLWKSEIHRNYVVGAQSAIRRPAHNRSWILSHFQ